MVFLSTPIDPDLWDRAGWRGAAFVRDPSGLERPGMALLFQNEKAGHQIFSGWHSGIGVADADECIRVAIIEGEVPGQEPGYFVHIGANPDLVAQHAKARHLLPFSRVHRMPPEPGSVHLSNFKRDFRRLGHYWLMPGFFRRGGPEPEWELAILKRKLALRTVDEIGEDDVDRVCFLGETN